MRATRARRTRQNKSVATRARRARQSRRGFPVRTSQARSGVRKEEERQVEHGQGAVFQCVSEQSPCVCVRVRVCVCMFAYRTKTSGKQEMCCERSGTEAQNV